MNSRLVRLTVTFVLVCSGTFAGQNPTQKTATTLDTEEIIKKFAAAESLNKIARNNYTFTQDIDIMTLGGAGSITGRYRRTSDIVYDDLGKRFEKISFFPPSTLTEINVSPEDLQDLGIVQPFAFATEDLSKYDVRYVGKEKIDELDTYIFEMKPKQIKKGERYLEGRVWVDDRDLQIVKVAGIAVPEVNGQKFPHFETYRENIDGRYWFPTYTYANDILEFKRGGVHFRMVVRYTNYKKFSGNIRLIDEGEAAAEDEAKSHETDKKGTEKEKEKEKEKKPPEPAPATEKPKRKPLP